MWPALRAITQIGDDKAFRLIFHGVGETALGDKMRNLIIVLSAVMMSTASFAAEERPATKAEIEKIAVGKTVNGRLKYTKDGRYTFEGRNPGRYTISAGKICIKFDDGRNRCDRIVTDGKKYTMVTSQGERYPYGR